MKTCPKCGSQKVVIFGANDHLCQDCWEWFHIADETVTATNSTREPHGN